MSGPPVAIATAEEWKWRKRLLPIMCAVVLGLSIFFFGASAWQLSLVRAEIEARPAVDYAALGIPAHDTSLRIASPEFRILASLDANLLERRYHQANAFLMGRLWTTYLGFVTGMILAMVGAVFILGMLPSAAFKASVGNAGVSSALESNSPGLVLAALGVALMITTILTNHPIQTADAPVFVGAYQGEAPAKPPSGSRQDSLEAMKRLNRVPANKP